MTITTITVKSKGIRCSWEGCWRTTTKPMADGWAYLFEWPAPIKDGYYCREHADAIEREAALDHLVTDEPHQRRQRATARRR
jgi:hypothetical protein